MGRWRRWVESEGLALGEVIIRAVTSDSGALLAAAAEPGEEQSGSIAKQYREAGYDC